MLVNAIKQGFFFAKVLVFKKICVVIVMFDFLVGLFMQEILRRFSCLNGVLEQVLSCIPGSL